MSFKVSGLKAVNILLLSVVSVAIVDSMPNGALGIFANLICCGKGIDLQVLETSQGGSHPQKEPVLALLCKRIRKWIQALSKAANTPKFMPSEPFLMFNSPNFG
jgi:hypothetical protein